MNQKISALGGDLHSGNIICVRCTEARGGGLDPNYGIQLCANRAGVEPLEDTLAHGRIFQLNTGISGTDFGQRWYMPTTIYASIATWPII